MGKKEKNGNGREKRGRKGKKGEGRIAWGGGGGAR